MKKFLTAMGFVALALTSCTEQPKEAAWIVDKFDDIKVIRYEVPEFENLPLNEKLLGVFSTVASSSFCRGVSWKYP